MDMDPDNRKISNLLDTLHPDDISFMAACEMRAVEFLFDFISPAELLKYKVSYCYRGRLRSGDYHLMLHQSIGIGVQDNKLERVFGIECDIHHITSENIRKISFLDIDGERSYMDLDVYNAKEFIPMDSSYTPRETEIIRLLSEGLTGNQIAIQLSISFDTVRTHRKNILEKSGCRNTTEVVANAIKEGVI